ncbi:hypothetical protein ES703_110269 [subsurface metagenome]
MKGIAEEAQEVTKAYFDGGSIRLYCKDSKDMSELEDESVDLIPTDPPYGIGFMGKDWDKFEQKKPTASQTVGWLNPGMKKDTRGMMEFFTPIWRECLRVLKPGGFAFVMCIPRADCLSRMIIALEDAGFRVDFTPIFWAYASGFPKAQNIGLTIDKQECRKQLTEKLGKKPTKEEFNKAWKVFREVTGKYIQPDGSIHKNPEPSSPFNQRKEGVYKMWRSRNNVETYTDVNK